MSAGDFTQSLQVRQNAGQASIFNPRLGRFTQPDTIIPGAANPQALNRYTYVLNNPVNFVDPSGHVPQCTDDGYCPKSWNRFNYETYASGAVRRDLESTYDIRLLGTWTYKEASEVKSAFEKLDDYAKGEQNINGIIQGSLSNTNAPYNVLVIENTTSAVCNGGTADACWNNNGTIYLSDAVFTSAFQKMTKQPDFFGLTGNLSLQIQVTVIHEMSHVLADAIPGAVTMYENVVSNPLVIHPNHNSEESMATAFGFYVAYGGQKWDDDLRDQWEFARAYDVLWMSLP